MVLDEEKMEKEERKMNSYSRAPRYTEVKEKKEHPGGPAFFGSGFDAPWPHLNSFEDLECAEHVPDVGVPADQRREEARVGGHVQLAHLVDHLHRLSAEEFLCQSY